MPDAVITVVAGRHAHLAAHRRALARQPQPPDLHVVVSMGDPAAGQVAAEAAARPPLLVIDLPADSQLPLAAARNAGARAALDRGADLLVFCDVDCLIGPGLLPGYRAAAATRPDALLCGPVTYLPPREHGWNEAQLLAARRPHPARPDPPAGELAEADLALFWSLSFAVTCEGWTAIGGFDEGYRGYGGEDTDFGRRAGAAGVPMLWVGGADAFHQHHATADPPVQHVDAVLRNGERFAGRWGSWPMTGWLAGFAELGLVHHDGDGWRRAAPLRIANVPPQHAYVDAVRPSTFLEADPDRVAGWAPDPLFDPIELRRRRAELDAVHVHFGYEHLEPAALASWLAVLRDEGLPLIVTVHDLHNPHVRDNTRHDAHLRLLLAAAGHVFTLTGTAARELAARYGCTAEVVAHPSMLDGPVPPTVPTRTVLVPLGALRANIADPGPLVAAAVDGAERGNGRVLVSVRPQVFDDPRLAPVRALADDGVLDLLVTGWEPHAAVVDRVAAAHALVLPYAFGTHSGWVELARDVGTHVVVPHTGCFAAQAAAAFTYADPASLDAAVALALATARPTPADRTVRRTERDLVRARHEIAYRRLVTS